MTCEEGILVKNIIPGHMTCHKTTNCLRYLLNLNMTINNVIINSYCHGSTCGDLITTNTIV